MRPSAVARSASQISLVTLIGIVASACAPTWAEVRRLHYVDDRLVASDPPAPSAYESYLRARLALERDPQDPEAARRHILDALRWDPGSAQLWTTRAEIEWLAGDFAAAEASLARALELQPGYPDAERLLVRVRTRDSITAASPSARAVQ